MIMTPLILSLTLSGCIALQEIIDDPEAINKTENKVLLATHLETMAMILTSVNTYIGDKEITEAINQSVLYMKNVAFLLRGKPVAPNGS